MGAGCGLSFHPAAGRPPRGRRPQEGGRRRRRQLCGRAFCSLASLSASPSAAPLSPEIGGRRSPDGRTDTDGRRGQASALSSVMAPDE